MHIYYYSLATQSGILLSVIGIVLVLYSMYNYLLINPDQDRRIRNTKIWKVFCWIETVVLFGTSFAEGILILLYSKFLYFEVSIWYLLALCICAIVDISAHLLFLFLIPYALNKLIKSKNGQNDYDSTLDKRKHSDLKAATRNENEHNGHNAAQTADQGKFNIINTILLLTLYVRSIHTFN